jgi:hypothetical protein
MGQLALSMGPARAEVCNFIQKATIPSKKVFLHSTFINTTPATIFCEYATVL